MAMLFTRFSLIWITGLCCLLAFAFAQPRLPNNEVDALKQIAKTLGKRNWNFSVDPCSQQEGWVTLSAEKDFQNNVTCNCSFSNNTVCHVVNILLKAQNLPGVLPPELIKLPHLQEIDLSRNYLNGTIPPEWGSMQLVNITLLGNRLTGSIPKELGNISTLQSFVLEYNQLSGALPAELGDLANLNRLLLSSNNFTGELPETLAKLTSLSDFRISDNQFSGKIPNFIKNWTKLQRLAIQASGLDGPIPSVISLFGKITDLRISDMKGMGSTFPPSMSNMKNMKNLILRSCNFTGEIPDYVGQMTKLKVLDLSFNKLTGKIPDTFDNLAKVNYMYLTGNMLTGPLPPWMSKNGKNIDLSYNNLTLGNSGASGCQQESVNIFAGSSLSNTSGGVVSCLKNFPCPKELYSLHINCGGSEVTINGNTTYQDDSDAGGSSRFISSRNNWGFSSTGNFMDNNDDIDAYIERNISRLSMNNSVLYMTARLSPISLTYYGLCLINGNYTVNLHFAEIVFTNDETYRSLGRRIFDVYIQGKRILKDFNIEDAAGGAGKAVIKRFTAVVTSGTLEIRFHWAGKGTAAIPSRGIYGPLISAISVNPDFVPPSEGGKKISGGAIAGIVISVICAIFLVLGILWWKGCLCRKDTMYQGQNKPNVQILSINKDK